MLFTDFLNEAKKQNVTLIVLRGGVRINLEYADAVEPATNKDVSGNDGEFIETYTGTAVAPVTVGKRRRRWGVLPSHVKSQIKQRAKSGESIRSIAEDFGLSESTVYRHIRQYKKKRS